MRRQLKWSLLRPAGSRKFFQLRYLRGGVWHAESLGTAVRRAAERAARARVEELAAEDAEETTWQELAEEYFERHMQFSSKSHRAVWSCARAKFEQISQVGSLESIDAKTLVRFSAQLVSSGLSTSTARAYCKYISGCLNWAEETEWIATAPPLPRAKRGESAAKMKGRPIPDDEFEDLIAALPGVVGEAAAPSWEELLRGLWLSGLRLGEALRLRWRPDPGGLWLEEDCRTISIDRGADKAGRASVLPVVPDFTTFALSLDRERETVFAPQGLRGRTVSDKDYVSKVIRNSATAAGIRATAHDLRRSFATRWAARVAPAVLTTLMRHGSVQTTMSYYVGFDARNLDWGLSPPDGETPAKPSRRS